MHPNYLKPSSTLRGDKYLNECRRKRSMYSKMEIFFCIKSICFSVNELNASYRRQWKHIYIYVFGHYQPLLLLSYVRANWMNGILRIEFRCGDGSEKRGSVFHAVWGNVERWRDKERRGLAFMKVHLDPISVHEGYSLCLFCLMSGVFL